MEGTENTAIAPSFHPCVSRGQCLMEAQNFRDSVCFPLQDCYLTLYFSEPTFGLSFFVLYLESLCFYFFLDGRPKQSEKPQKTSPWETEKTRTDLITQDKCLGLALHKNSEDHGLAGSGCCCGHHRDCTNIVFRDWNKCGNNIAEPRWLGCAAHGVGGGFGDGHELSLSKLAARPCHPNSSGCLSACSIHVNEITTGGFPL